MNNFYCSIILYKADNIVMPPRINLANKAVKYLYNDNTFGTPIFGWSLETLTFKEKVTVRNGKIYVQTQAFTQINILLPVHRLCRCQNKNICFSMCKLSLKHRGTE